MDKDKTVRRCRVTVDILDAQFGLYGRSVHFGFSLLQSAVLLNTASVLNQTDGSCTELPKVNEA